MHSLSEELTHWRQKTSGELGISREDANKLFRHRVLAQQEPRKNQPRK
jgi:hypothetical protein